MLSLHSPTFSRAELPSKRINGVRSEWLLPVVAALCVAACAQAPEKAEQPEQKGQPELEARVLAAQAARNTRDPLQIAHANRLVIAASFRELGDLKLVQGDYAASVKRYG